MICESKKSESQITIPWELESTQHQTQTRTPKGRDDELSATIKIYSRRRPPFHSIPFRGSQEGEEYDARCSFALLALRTEREISSELPLGSRTAKRAAAGSKNSRAAPRWPLS